MSRQRRSNTSSRSFEAARAEHRAREVGVAADDEVDDHEGSQGQRPARRSRATARLAAQPERRATATRRADAGKVIAAPTSAPKRPGAKRRPREHGDADERRARPRGAASTAPARVSAGPGAEQDQAPIDRLELVADAEEAHAEPGFGPRSESVVSGEPTIDVDRVGDDRDRGRRRTPGRRTGSAARSPSSARARRAEPRRRAPLGERPPGRPPPGRQQQERRPRARLRQRAAGRHAPRGGARCAAASAASRARSPIGSEHRLGRGCGRSGRGAPAGRRRPPDRGRSRLDRAARSSSSGTSTPRRSRIVGARSVVST